MSASWRPVAGWSPPRQCYHKLFQPGFDWSMFSLHLWWNCLFHFWFSDLLKLCFRMEEIRQYYKFRPDEIFRRITMTSLATLMIETSKLEYQEEDAERLSRCAIKSHISYFWHFFKILTLFIMSELIINSKLATAEPGHFELWDLNLGPLKL